MANAIITNSYIARKFIQISRNTNAFLMNVNRQYDGEFERTGAKAGQNIRIRLPVEYNLRTGPTAIVQDSVQKVLNLTVAMQTGVDMSFSSVDRTMNVDRFTENFINPAVNTIVGGIAADVMSGADGGVSNWVANQDPVTGALLSPTINTWLNAKASLEKNAVPDSNYKIVMDPSTQANTVANLAGYFNSQPVIAKQYENGDMTRALGFDWMADNTVILHTTGAYATNPTYTTAKGFAASTVNGAGQVGTVLTVAAMAGPLAKGDIISVDGVYNVNPVTKAATARLKHFVVTAPTLTGATSIPIYPSILGANAGVAQQYQTVSVSPANGATVFVAAAPGSVYRKNLAYVPKAMTLATVDLILPPNVDAAREVFDEVSVRVITQYQGTSDQLLTRLDLLYGFAYLKPEWMVIVPDPVT